MQRYSAAFMLGLLVAFAGVARAETIYPSAPHKYLNVPCADCADGHCGEEGCGHAHGYGHHHGGGYGHYCWDHHFGIPALFHEPPLGYYVYNALNAQVHQGIIDQLVIYHYDFMFGDRSAKLSPRGKHQLLKYADLMITTGAGPLLVEPTMNRELDEARRIEILAVLTAIHDSFPEESVVIGRPRAPGLRGEEAVINHAGQMLNTARRGKTLGSPMSANSTIAPVNSDYGSSGP